MENKNKEQTIENTAPISIDTLHDILHYAFIFFTDNQKKSIPFIDYFNENLKSKKFEIEDLEKQKIVFKDFDLMLNYQFLANNGFICNDHGITNKGIQALMKIDIIQYSTESNKQAKKWIALLE